MKRISGEAGYLMEIPLIVAAITILLITIFPLLSKYPVLAKIAVVCGAAVVTAGLYYMIVIPGWQPASVKRLSWPANIIVFGIIAIAIACGVLVFVLK